VGGKLGMHVGIKKQPPLKQRNQIDATQAITTRKSHVGKRVGEEA